MRFTFTNMRHDTATTVRIFTTQQNNFIKLAFIPDEILDAVASLLCPEGNCSCGGFDQKPYEELLIRNWFEIPKKSNRQKKHPPNSQNKSNQNRIKDE